MAHRACSAINGSASAAAFRRAGRAETSPTLPRATQTLRSRPRRFVRKIGEPAKRDLKPAGVELQQFDQIWRFQICARVWLHQLSFAGEAVPRTDRQAIVAAVNAIADGRTQFDRNGPFQLDGQIGNALARIKRERRGDGIGRAGGEAARATATMIFSPARPAPVRAS